MLHFEAIFLAVAPPPTQSEMVLSMDVYYYLSVLILVEAIVNVHLGKVMSLKCFSDTKQPPMFPGPLLRYCHTFIYT